MGINLRCFYRMNYVTNMKSYIILNIKHISTTWVGMFLDLMQKSGMLSLMDAQARYQWNKSLKDRIFLPSVKLTYSVPLNNFITAREKCSRVGWSTYSRSFHGITKPIVPAVLERRSSSIIWRLTIVGATARTGVGGEISWPIWKGCCFYWMVNLFLTT